MQIPDRVKIMGHEYLVIMDPLLFAREDVGSGKACANSLEITLSPGVPESRKAETFLHEIIEMVKYTLQITIEHKDLSALSEGLFTVIRDNGLDFRI